MVPRTVLHFFGFPALERCHKKNVIVVTAGRETKGTPSPVVTVFVKSSNTKSGWKRTTRTYGFVKNLCIDLSNRTSDHGKLKIEKY